MKAAVQKSWILQYKSTFELRIIKVRYFILKTVRNENKIKPNPKKYRKRVLLWIYYNVFRVINKEKKLQFNV